MYLFSHMKYEVKSTAQGQTESSVSIHLPELKSRQLLEKKKIKWEEYSSNLQLLANMHVLLCSTYKWTKRICSSFNPLLEQILACLPTYSKMLKLIHRVIQNSNVSLWQKCWLLEKNKANKKNKNSSLLLNMVTRTWSHQALSVHKSEKAEYFAIQLKYSTTPLICWASAIWWI